MIIRGVFGVIELPLNGGWAFFADACAMSDPDMHGESLADITYIARCLMSRTSSFKQNLLL